MGAKKSPWVWSWSCNFCIVYYLKDMSRGVVGGFKLIVNMKVFG